MLVTLLHHFRDRLACRSAFTPTRLRAMHSSCARNLDAWLPAQGRQPPRLAAPRRRIPDERFA